MTADEEFIQEILIAYRDGKIDFANVPKLDQTIQAISKAEAQQVTERYLESLSDESLVHAVVNQTRQLRDETKRLTAQNQQLQQEFQQEQTCLQAKLKTTSAEFIQSAQEQRQQLENIQKRLLIPAIAGFGVFLISVGLIFFIFFNVGG